MKEAVIKGSVVEWNDAKGYGFISASGSKQKVFIHYSAVKNKRRPRLGDNVRFELGQDDRGRSAARDVRILSLPRMETPVKLSVGFLVAASASVLAFDGQSFFILAYVVMSLVTFVAYAMDKNAARKGKWRTPESTLHLLALFCGWPGALIAQNQLRHKSRKQPFKAILWVTIVVNVGVFVFAFTPGGWALILDILKEVI